VCFYIPKKENIKKRQFTKRTLYSVVGLGIVFFSGNKFQTTPPPLVPGSQSLHPYKSIPVARIDLWQPLLEFYLFSTAPQCFTAVSGVQLTWYWFLLGLLLLLASPLMV